MARNHAHLSTAGITDPDWVALSPGAQWLYVLLLRQPRLSLAGHLDVLPERWASASATVNADDVRRWFDELVAGRYLLHDCTTGEVLIRTFTRHDLDPNRLSLPVVKGFWGAWNGILSARLKAFVVANLPDAVWAKVEGEASDDAREIRRSGPFEWEPPAPPEREGPPPFESPSSFLLSPVSATAPGSISGQPQAPQPEPDPVVVDEQTIRKTAVLVGRAIAALDGRDDAYAHGITKRILTEPGGVDLEQITDRLAAGEAPERIAATWRQAPMLYPVVDRAPEPARPSLVRPDCDECGGAGHVFPIGALVASRCPVCNPDRIPDGVLADGHGVTA